MSHTEKSAQAEPSTAAMDNNNNNNSARVSSQQDVSDSEKAAQATSSPPAPPDGGVTAWLVVLGGWCTAFCSFGWLNSIGVFQQYYQKELLRGQNSSTVSWIPSLQIFFILGLVGSFDLRTTPFIANPNGRVRSLAHCLTAMDHEGYYWWAH